MRTTLVEVALAHALEGYLREFIALSPHSSAGRMDAAMTAATPSSLADRLARYMELKDHCAVGLLRFCSEQQARILVRRHLTRKYTPRSQRVGYVDVPTEGQVSEMSRADLAKAERLSVSQYRRELTRALEAVGHALSETARQREAA